ncbi:MAG: hypothetical protein OEV45_09435, partial [Desulfobacteraceae bacterium]|nr:hypothetical protein [Desulfobacteraceae bacterium]
ECAGTAAVYGFTLYAVKYFVDYERHLNAFNYCPSINGLFTQSAGGGQVSALCSKNNPRNIKHMPVVIFFECLDLEQKSSFMDGHN